MTDGLQVGEPTLTSRGPVAEHKGGQRSTVDVPILT